MELDLYIALKEKILTDIPTVRTVGLFNNQFVRQQYEDNQQDPFNYPAVFVEFNNYNFRDLSQGVQEFDFEMNLHLGFESYKDEDTDILQLKQDLFKVVHRFQNGYFAKLSRVGQVQDFDHANTQVYILKYRGYGRDYTADIRNNQTGIAIPVLVTSISTGTTSN